MSEFTDITVNTTPAPEASTPAAPAPAPASVEREKEKKPKRTAGEKAQGQVPKACAVAYKKHCKAQGIKPADFVRDAVIAATKKLGIYDPSA